MTGRPPVQRSGLAGVCVPPGRTQAPFQRSPADAARTSRRSTRGPGGAGTSLYAGLVTPPELRIFCRAVDHRNTPKHTREPINTPHRATRRPVAARCASPRGDPNPPKMRRSGRVVAVSAPFLSVHAARKDLSPKLKSSLSVARRTPRSSLSVLTCAPRCMHQTAAGRSERCILVHRPPSVGRFRAFSPAGRGRPPPPPPAQVRPLRLFVCLPAHKQPSGPHWRPRRRWPNDTTPPQRQNNLALTPRNPATYNDALPVP